MDKYLIELLKITAEELTKEAKAKESWGQFGNSYGAAECKKFLIAISEILKTIADNI